MPASGNLSTWIRFVICRTGGNQQLLRDVGRRARLCFGPVTERRGSNSNPPGCSRELSRVGQPLRCTRIQPTRHDPCNSCAALSIAGCATSTVQTRSSVQSTSVDPRYLRTPVRYDSNEPPGTIIVDAPNHYLYLAQKGGQAMRYGVGVGKEGFGWSGMAVVHDKQEWPDWYPPKEMLQRRPEIQQAMKELAGGLGMPGGPENPLGSRALYLWQGNMDTLYRIHGTNEPWTIGQSVSSGCIRMTNDDVIDLYDHTQVGTKVIVLPSHSV